MSLFAAMAGAGSGALAELLQPRPAGAMTQQVGTSGSLPSHLTSLDFADPNAFVPWAWGAGQAYGQGSAANVLADLDAFITANLSQLRTSQIPRVFAERDRAGNLPQTIREMVDAFLDGIRAQPHSLSSADSLSAGDPISTGALCIEGPEGCIDTGCDDVGGDCWEVPAPIVEWLGTEPCECVYRPKWYEVALLALILLLLIATPGPDEIAAIAAAASRLIIRAAPAIA